MPVERASAVQLALITLLIATIGPLAHAAVLPGTIDSDMTLTTADSPWLLRSNVLIAADAHVTVEPNVHIVAEGDWRLTVAGSLTAMAPMGTRIVFRAPEIDASGAWKGLLFNPGSVGRFQRCTFRSATTNVTVSAADVRLYNCHVRLASEDGVMALGDAFLKCAYCRFQNNGRHGLQIQTSAPEGAIIASEFIGSGQHPVRVKAGCLQMLRRDNSFEANGVEALGVDCGSSIDIDDTVCWRDQVLPLDMTIGSPTAELVIAEGEALRIKSGIRIYPPHRIVVRGRLLVDGLPDAPVVIQPKGAATAGDWAGIALSAGAVVRMANATVGFAEDGFRADDARVYLKDTLVRDCSRNGIYAGGSAHVDLAGCTISACARNGVAIPQATSSAKIHTTSVVECGDYPVRVAATVAEALRHGNYWRDNARQAIGVVCGTDPDIRDDDTWHAQSIPFDLTADPDATTLTVGSSGRLSIQEGAKVVGGTLRASGVLVAAGTPDHPVTFDAATASPAPGDWVGIEYAPGSAGRLVNAEVRNAQIGVNVQSDGWIQLRNTLVHHCAQDGIRAGGDSVPLITGCTSRNNGRWGVSVYHNAEPLLGLSGSAANPGLNSFINNAEYDLANQTGRAIVAQRNWWGHSAQAEIGARILDRSEDASLGPVNFTPFLTGPPASGSGTSVASSAPLAVMSVAAVEAGEGAAINVALSRPADVRISLRNIAGRPVRTIDTRAESRTVVTWDGRDLRGNRVPAGRYVVEVEAFAETGECSRALTSVQLRR